MKWRTEEFLIFSDKIKIERKNESSKKKGGKCKEEGLKEKKV